MTTYVMVHGAWHGAWCWYKIVPRLRQEGHRVVTLDLPGHGTDETPIEEVTLQTQVDCVDTVLDEADEPVVLVGHSAGGVIITEAAEQHPENISTLVYVSAFLLPDGTSLMEVNRNDEGSLVPPNLIIDEDMSHAMVRENVLEETFYADCAIEEVTLCKSLLQPEPMTTFTTPVETTDERFGSIPRIYIESLEDRAISSKSQKEMYTTLPCETVHTLETGHSPFLSAPDELTNQLLSV